MHDRGMRTTIEIDETKLRRLREMAARRGEKGYSRLIDEALERYLSDSGAVAGDERMANLLALAGTWSDADAEEVRGRIAESRKHWR
jgi:metal-responsive CopG/Arc/MetJ family transcriptional regulator